MRHYATRHISPASLDAMRERRPAPGPRDDMRQPGRLLLDIGSQVIDLRLVPDRRDVRRWLAYKDGEPYLHAGLERIWRRVQSEISPPLGRVHW
jgi:hypothetical protein